MLSYWCGLCRKVVWLLSGIWFLTSCAPSALFSGHAPCGLGGKERNSPNSKSNRTLKTMRSLSLSLSLSVSLCLCLSLSLSLLHIHTHTHTHARTHAHTLARTHTHARMHARTHARAHARTHTRTYTHARAHTHTVMHSALVNGFTTPLASPWN